MLTLYRAASDPTYLERGGRNQFSARGAPIGQIMIPPQTLRVKMGLQKKNWVDWPKIGPVAPIWKFQKLANLAES